MIKNICNIFVFVEDQEKAKKFWCEKVGFKVKEEIPMGNNNDWLEVVPPEGGTSLVLFPKSMREDSSTSKSIITFFTENINKTYEDLSLNGVKFSKKPYNTGYGLFTEFEDEDGNTFSLKEV